MANGQEFSAINHRHQITDPGSSKTPNRINNPIQDWWGAKGGLKIPRHIILKMLKTKDRENV